MATVFIFFGCVLIIVFSFRIRKRRLIIALISINLNQTDERDPCARATVATGTRPPTVRTTTATPKSVVERDLRPTFAFHVRPRYLYVRGTLHRSIRRTELAGSKTNGNVRERRVKTSHNNPCCGYERLKLNRSCLRFGDVRL